MLFPHAQLPLHVFEPRYRALAADCLEADARFGIVLIARGSEVGGGDERMLIGTRAVITQAASLSDGRSLMMVRGEARIRVIEWLPDDPYPLARVDELAAPVDPVDPATLERAVQASGGPGGCCPTWGAAPPCLPTPASIRNPTWPAGSFVRPPP